MKKPQDAKVYCRRLKEMKPLAEHTECMYCFGKLGQVDGSHYDHFCDYDPDKDPIHFGFPQDSSRDLSG
ncbi:MAG: hypothetical protein H6834_06375 [Planctomycetes bacterium]|nr:hypothetical protein [Planctomycetota bacterium]